MHPPRTVLASLAAIALTGVALSVTTTRGGAPLAGLLFLLLPLLAAACWRRWRFSRAALCLVAGIALLPLTVGLVLTWPHRVAMLPYAVAALVLVTGLAGLFSPAARAWHAAQSAPRARR
ncbi:MAG: hypothetical protein IT355_12995 [Gemmatimonadaceae bacterium]|nr:hypothetical protein [Gemmatimonadaceae bacterium]